MKTTSARVHAVHPSSPIELRHRVFRLRYRVYVEEMGLAVGGDAWEGLSDSADEIATSFLCEVDGVDVGTLRFVGGRDRRLELFDQSGEWASMIESSAKGQPRYFEVNRFMVLREARRSDVAMRLVNAAFRHAIRSGYRECYIAAKQGRLLDYYKRFYRGQQLTTGTTAYRLGDTVLGEYHLMRFNLGGRWSLRRMRLALYYRLLTFCAAHLRPVVGLALGRRSGFNASAVPREVSSAPSRPLLGG